VSLVILGLGVRLGKVGLGVCLKVEWCENQNWWSPNTPQDLRICGSLIFWHHTASSGIRDHSSDTV